MAVDVVFKDFTKAKKRVTFQIDDDTFEAPSVLPVPVMQELAKSADGLKAGASSSETLGQVVDVFNVILLDSSAEKLRGRIASKDNPVDLEQLIDVMLWLLEVYGLRPTQPSSDSSTGQPNDVSGTPSTAGAPSAE